MACFKDECWSLSERKPQLLPSGGVRMGIQDSLSTEQSRVGVQVSRTGCSCARHMAGWGRVCLGKWQDRYTCRHACVHFGGCMRVCQAGGLALPGPQSFSRWPPEKVGPLGGALCRHLSLFFLKFLSPPGPICPNPEIESGDQASYPQNWDSCGLCEAQSPMCTVADWQGAGGTR